LHANTQPTGDLPGKDVTKVKKLIVSCSFVVAVTLVALIAAATNGLDQGHASFVVAAAAVFSTAATFVVNASFSVAAYNVTRSRSRLRRHRRRR
jgi:hypothetical protein